MCGVARAGVGVPYVGVRLCVSPHGPTKSATIPLILSLLSSVLPRAPSAALSAVYSLPMLFILL
jgi:hypothetical protein